ncbi:MAG: T9SS type A sorting domain-containing protein, partial [Ignavibacteria bacterium]|nr:T9SS type A sorting domain-containing protein [Ignavibacteria bacterium]
FFFSHTAPSSNVGIAGGAEICKVGNAMVLLLNYQNFALGGYKLRDVGPQIAHTPLSNTQNLTGPYVVNCVITPVGVGLMNGATKLYWSRDNPSAFDSIAMTNPSGNNWTGNIPGNGMAATYRYYIMTMDSLNRIGASGSSSNPHTFLAIGTDTTKPVITHTPLGNCIKASWPPTVNASATDPFGIDSMWVTWKKGVSGAFNRFNLAKGTGNSWSGAFNSDSSQVAVGDVIYYRVVARDASAQLNMDSTAEYNFLIDSASIIPDLIYYKFLNNPSANTVFNYAIPGVGNNPATLTSLTLTSGGQFDSCLSGTATASAKITTGYNLSTGTSSFTISMWLNNLPTPASTRYLFGDLGHSFRCFVGGVAPSGGAVLRGTGVTDVPINNIFPGPTVIHIVYDSAISAVKIYKNGVLDNTVSQAPFNFTAGTGFTVGGYSSSAGLQGLMDEFRFYKRALDAAEISQTWNQNLGVITGVTPVSKNIPTQYSLSQNYPNPFNPMTKINFALPKQGFVTMKIYDVLGREVRTLVNEVREAGNYIVEFNASELASGIYFYRIEVNGFSDVKRMMLIK